MLFADAQLNNDIKNCNNLPSKWSYWCNEKAKQLWIRRLDWMKDTVYPWNNRDWDYKQFVKNRYDPEDVLKLRKGGSISDLINNIDILIKQIESLLTAPNPDGGSVAGITDQPSSNNPNKQRFLELKRQISILSSDPEKNRNQIQALHDALNQIISNKGITSKEYGLGLMQDGTFQKPPYEDSFFNKTLTGESSSSYFIQTGFCKTKEANETECRRKKFRWIGDTCYKPKYIYINNSPGFKIGRVKGMKGLVPSIINDITQLNPDSINGIMNGYSVPGVDIQQCMDEYFQDYSKHNQEKKMEKLNPNLASNAPDQKNLNKIIINKNKDRNSSISHNVNHTQTKPKIYRKVFRNDYLDLNINKNYYNRRPFINNYYVDNIKSNQNTYYIIIILLLFIILLFFYRFF